MDVRSWRYMYKLYRQIECMFDLLFWIFYVFVLSCICYVFVRVLLCVLCGHLLGKGWPVGSRLWCLTVSLSLSHSYPWSGVELVCIDSWSLHPYLFDSGQLHIWAVNRAQTCKWCSHISTCNIAFKYVVVLTFFNHNNAVIELQMDLVQSIIKNEIPRWPPCFITFLAPEGDHPTWEGHHIEENIIKLQGSSF